MVSTSPQDSGCWWGWGQGAGEPHCSSSACASPICPIIIKLQGMFAVAQCFPARVRVTDGLVTSSDTHQPSAGASLTFLKHQPRGQPKGRVLSAPSHSGLAFLPQLSLPASSHSSQNHLQNGPMVVVHRHKEDCSSVTSCQHFGSRACKYFIPDSEIY